MGAAYRNGPRGIALLPAVLDKRFSTLQARLAMRGYQLQRSGDAFLVTRWNLTRSLPTLDAVEVFCTGIGG